MATLCRETWSFALLSGSEQADTSLWWFSGPGVVGDLAAAINAEQNDLWETIRGQFGTGTSQVKHTLSVVDIDDGTVVSTIDLDLPTNPDANDTGKQLPLQTTPVLSLRTALAGPSFRGRMYLPPVTSNIIDDDGYLIAGYRNNFVDAYAAFITAVQGATAWDAGVYSRRLTSFTPLASVDMGSVLDTQRRRRNELVEARYSSAV